MLPCQENSRSFFEKLQNADGLDLLDNRGKRHDLAVVLVGVTLAVLGNRDGSSSSLHRHLANHPQKLVTVLGVEKKQPVSRSQLPLILEKVAFEVFDKLLFAKNKVTDELRLDGMNFMISWRWHKTRDGKLAKSRPPLKSDAKESN